MRTLTPEEEKFLVDYCLKPENRWLALAIGQIQTELRMAIVASSSFLKDLLDKRVRKNLEECGLHCWKTCAPGTNLEVRGGGGLYLMTMEDPKIEIQLCYEGGKDLFVGTLAQYKKCPKKERLESFFEGRNLNLRENNYWRWWFYPESGHRSIEELITLILHQDDEVKLEQKVEYFTDILVSSAKAISKALEA